MSLVVLSFATLGFLAVPIGPKTGYEHVRGALATPQAAHLGDALGALGRKLKETLIHELERVGALKDEASDDD